MVHGCTGCNGYRCYDTTQFSFPRHDHAACSMQHCSTAARVTLHMIPDQPCPADQEVFISLSYLLSGYLDTGITKLLCWGKFTRSSQPRTQVCWSPPGCWGRGGGGITRLLRIRSQPGYNPCPGHGHVSPAQPRVSSIGTTRVLARVLRVGGRKSAVHPRGCFTLDATPPPLLLLGRGLCKWKSIFPGVHSAVTVSPSVDWYQCPPSIAGLKQSGVVA